MPWSQLHIPTRRQDPADAEAVSHRLLVRAGFIRQLMAGHYSLLPLAVRVRAKVIEIIREEMNRIGGQELLLPAMHPAGIWRRTGRWDVMGEEMFRLRDRKAADIALGMTHEEIFTTLALELRSYRDLPQVWYQFQTKFRDEPRPKSGLLRVREFTMKDSYSFDLDAEGLDRSFDAHHQAYTRSFARMGIPTIPVQASSGSMGGSASVEFMCPSEAGEDLVARCQSCGYAANVEKATSALPALEDGASLPAPDRFPTPSARTIEDLARDFGAPAERQIKTLIYVLDGQPTLVLLRGDHIAPCASRRDPGDTRCVSRQSRRGRRDRSAGHRRRGAAWPSSDVHRREHRRRPPAWGGRRAGHQGRPLGGPTRGHRRRAVPNLRPAAGGTARDRGRPHFQTRLQVR